MKSKLIAFLSIILFTQIGVYSQSTSESCQIIESEVKGGIYKNFSINNNGYLTYNWIDKKSDSETLIFIDLTKVTISKDISQRGYRVFINCIDGIDCINEKGKLGKDEAYYSNFSKTYIPTNDEKGMTIVYNQLLFLLKLGSENR